MKPKPKPKFPWAQANRHAERLIGYVHDVCEQIQVAGSLRRRRPLVSDIELLAVPKWNHDLLGQPTDNRLWRRLDLGHFEVDGGEPGNWRITAERKRGPKWRAFDFTDTLLDRSIPVDLFTTTPSGLAVLLAIRTGPAAFSRMLVTNRSHGGLLPDGHAVLVGKGEVRAGVIWDGGEMIDRGRLVPMASERQFIQFCAGEWIEPEERDDWTARRQGRRT